MTTSSKNQNALGLLGAAALQKVFGSFRMLTYDVPADSMDEVVRIAESTMVTTISEAKIRDITTRECVINGNKYTMGYYLIDGIYPTWATFVKSYNNPQGNKRVQFTKAQEAVRKDVERAFGVLQARFAMVRGPTRFWDKDTLWYIMTSAVILHNMIIKNERDEEVDYDYNQDGGEVLRPEEYQHRHPLVIENFLKIHLEIEDKETRVKLRDDLVEHLWAHHSAS
ncbi:uncharacterized protein LOC111257310 [Setaria italica]|uniref:uncharacterized protein LOC111257310 n=1 Tax=Setaria italica TaxID=4555 RepID=UPI000350ED8C|nr:uncharacterized protein LOC111257310 [Setaria italica]